MEQEKLERINELARKQRSEGLTAEEKEEQALLRSEFIESIKRNLRSNLDRIDIEEEDGRIINLKEKVKKHRMQST